MDKGRLEAFSDGVIAILITIMVLELRVPHETDWRALGPLVPVLLSYVLSFVFLGIYWNNHHHMFQLVERINGRIMWANLHLLFWLSLVPFVTTWMGENHAASVPVAIYGVVLLMAGLAYTLLQTSIIAEQGEHSPLSAAIGRDVKGKMSAAMYAVAVAAAFFHPWIAAAIYVGIAAAWLVPDRRIENQLPLAR
ncbi:MAG: TMEM175 family protein [Gemmatimonadaceae bacterium]